MKPTVDVAEVTRKIIKIVGLPQGFYYGTDTHIVEGIGKVVYAANIPEGVMIGMEDKTVIVGTKKAPAPTDAHVEATC